MLDTLVNGFIVYDSDNAGPVYDLGTRATHNCNSGYQLFGDMIRTCTSGEGGVGGVFGGAAPSCERKYTLIAIHVYRV